MVAYKYIAKTSSGEEVVGVMDAESETAVARSLDEQRLYPVRVTEEAAPKPALQRGRVRLRDVGVMYGQLSDLLQAGVPMLQALDTIVKACPNKRLGGVVARVREEVAGGRALAEAMTEHPDVFSTLHAAMVRAGERAGFLEDVLNNLSEFIERQDELRSKVRGAMIYPLVLTTLGSIIVVVVLVVLVPKFKPLLEAAPKPLPTQILFGLSDLLVDHLLLLIGMVVLLGLGVRAFVRSEFGRGLWDRWRLKIPLFGRMVRMVSITRFCRILGTMLSNGVPIIEALNISKGATGCSLMADRIGKAAESVRAGERVADPLRTGGLFPVEVLEMISVAEESNRLEKVLLQIADTIERRTNRQVDQVVRLIEPLILVLLAVAIGFVAVGLLYPIFTISEALNA
jgi:general secretion pathway protein F/type IV pilus assembly protein PilC